MQSMLILANWQITALGIAFVLVCLFMMLVILIQKPKGGGLSGAFGGAGGSAQAAFGAKTGDVLTWFTVICFALFLLLAMGLTWTIRPEHYELARQIRAEEAAEAGESDLQGAMEAALQAPAPTTDASEGEPGAVGAAAESIAPADQPDAGGAASDDAAPAATAPPAQPAAEDGPNAPQQP